MQGVPVCRGGLAADFDEDELKKKLDEPDCSIRFAHSRTRARARALLDLRLHRRLHPNQRQLPDLSKYSLLAACCDCSRWRTAAGRTSRRTSGLYPRDRRAI